MGTILCGVDQSAAAMAAVSVAHKLSVRFDAGLLVVHVAEGYRKIDDPDSLIGSQVKHVANRLLDDVASKHLGGAEVECQFAVGDPAERLAAIAAEEEADLIVVGARQRGRRGDKLVSSLAARLREVTDCPVVVVPSGAS